MRAYWGTEGVQPTESEPAFQQVSFTAWDLLIDCLASNQFVADMGADGEQRLIYEFGRASAWYVDYAFFNGTGSGGQMPLGILKAPCKKTVSRVVAGHVSQTDVGAMVASLLPRCYRTAVWACSPTAIEDVIKLPGMQPNQPAIPAMGEESSLCGVLFGRPVFVTEKLPAMGTAGDLILFDPAEYLIGDRQQVTIDASEHPRFRNNQTTFRVWVRVDGKPLLSDTVTLADGTTEVSSVVVLG
jgi:HK97 family phage major capsid protein